MKRNALIFVALMVFSFGLANAQDVLDLNADPTGFWDDGGTPSVTTDAQIAFQFRLITQNKITGHSNGFTIFLSDNPGGYPIDPAGVYSAIDTTGYAGAGVGSGGTGIVNFDPAWDDLGFFINMFSTNGSGADTVGFGGAAIFGGVPAGTDVVAYQVATEVGAVYDDVGKYLCVDSAFYPPGGAWLWSTTAGSLQPDWGGPYCYHIKQIPNQDATFDNPQGGATTNVDHCTIYTYDYDGTDPDPANCPVGTGVVYSIVSDGGLNGTAAIDANGVFSYQWVPADGIGCYTVEVRVEDQCGAGSNDTFELCFTNQNPTITCLVDSLAVGRGNSITFPAATANNVDCDPGSFSVSAAPATVNPPTITAGGSITFDADFTEGDQCFIFTVTYSDGLGGSASCDIEMCVLSIEPFEIQIEKTHNTFQGGHELVEVYQNLGSEVPGGFDFLIAYDASALSFQAAYEGDIYSKCGWEYFTYRYGAQGNCGGGCPSGLLRVVGIAETNNGANHPVEDCKLAAGETYFTLDFLVSDNRTFECQYVPIRFFWLDCGDNAISNQGGDTLWLSRFVYDFEGDDITNPNYGWPTYFGAQTECFDGGGPNKPVPIDFIDFINGGIDIACADSIDARGDLNLNGVSNEIADAVLYSNYFVSGLGVFTINVQGQTAASDVNADGIALSVADLVYLIRIVVGDALPYPKLAPVDAQLSYGSELVVDQKMGAAFVMIDGQASPALLANNMEMKYNYDAEENVTRVLVYSMEANQTFEGAFLAPNGNVLSVELATYDGAPVKLDMVPAEYSLNQNYPNPFNPTTTIGFALAQAGDYSLKVYNVTGQEVAAFEGSAQAGMVEIEFDASDLASGVYFYKLDAGAFSDTKKMVLLK